MRKQSLCASFQANKRVKEGDKYSTTGLANECQNGISEPERHANETNPKSLDGC